LVAFGRRWVEMRATLREWVGEQWSQFQGRAGEKLKRVKAIPVKIIRPEPVVPVEAEIALPSDGAETVEPVPLSQPTYRRRKRKLAIRDHSSAQLVLPQGVDGAACVLPDPAVSLRDPAVRANGPACEEVRDGAPVA